MNADSGQVVDLISVDAGLSSRVLRLSNSVFFRGSLSVQSLDEAIGRVGFREVHKIVGIAMVEQAFSEGLPAYHLSAKAIFENSLCTALAMEIIARSAGEDGHEAYTAGLMRQLGKLVLGRILEKEHPGVTCAEDDDVCTWELQQFNITSHEVTALVLEAWKLPPEFFHGIRHHHRPEADVKHGPLGAMMHLACWIVQMLGYGMKSEARVWELTPERLEKACVSEEYLRESVEETGNAFNALKEQLGIG
jgi:HD-like signal output (HDOD) protein